VQQESGDTLVRTLAAISLSVFILAACPYPAAAQDQATNADERFKWWWEREEGADAGQQRQSAPQEEVNPPVSSPAAPAIPAGGGQESLSDEYERLIKDNVELRKSIAETEKRYRDAETRNSDLTGKMKELETRETDLARAMSELKSGGTMSGDAGRRLEEVRGEMDAARNENQALKQRVTSLTAELEKRQAQKAIAAAEPALSEGSDLYKRLTEENALLRKNLMEMKDVEKRAAEARKTLSLQDEDRSQKVEGMKAQLAELEDKNRRLKETLQTLQTRTSDTEKLEAELQQVRGEVEKRDRLLERTEQETQQLREQAAGAVRPVDLTSARSEAGTPAAKKMEVAMAEGPAGGNSRNDLYFNMAVLYVKTGMYRQAEQELLRLLKAEGSSPDLHYNLAILYDTYLGDKHKARKHYRKFLELSPTGSDAEKVRLWLLETEMDL
jgi:tetratricopeptide (TPR) repeat protein